MPVIDKLAWICVKDNRILCARSRGKDAFYVPGGKRETGESNAQALIREVKEELSVNLIPDTLHFEEIFQAQAHGKPLGTIVKMTCYTADFRGEIKPDSEIEALKWMSYADKDIMPPVDKLIFDWLHKKGSL